MVRVKICGITNLEDGLAAARAGADAVGIVFHESSPRYLPPEEAARLTARFPPFLSVVGLFVNHRRDDIRYIAALCRLDLIQLHGDEPPEACLDLPCRTIKAFRVSTPADLGGVERYPVNSVLLDAKVDGRYGGSGICLDWGVAATLKTSKPVILAGGLNPDNVAAAIARVQPYAVDVSSGVETMPGRKDHQKIEAFIRAVRSGEGE